MNGGLSAGREELPSSSITLIEEDRHRFTLSYQLICFSPLHTPYNTIQITQLQQYNLDNNRKEYANLWAGNAGGRVCYIPSRYVNYYTESILSITHAT